MKLVEQLGTRSITIAYDEPAGGSDVVTITHAPLPSGEETMRDEIEEAIAESFTDSLESSCVYNKSF